MRKLLVILAGLALITAAGPTGKAEAQVQFGPQIVLWDLDQPAVGARVDFALAPMFGIEEGFFENLTGSANVSYIFGDSESFMDQTYGWSGLLVNLNGIVPFDIDAPVTPFVGAGINHTRISNTFEGEGMPGFGITGSMSGLNLLGGVEFGVGNFPLFAELQYSTSGAGALSLSLGIMFGGG